MEMWLFPIIFHGLILFCFNLHSIFWHICSFYVFQPIFACTHRSQRVRCQSNQCEYENNYAVKRCSQKSWQPDIFFVFCIIFIDWTDDKPLFYCACDFFALLLPSFGFKFYMHFFFQYSCYTANGGNPNISK